MRITHKLNAQLIHKRNHFVNHIFIDPIPGFLRPAAVEGENDDDERS